MENPGASAAASSMRSGTSLRLIWGATSPPVMSWGTAACLRVESCLETEKCLAARGRGAREELGVPVPSNSANFEGRQRRCHLHQRDQNRSCGNRRGRVHHDAKRAMIGVADALVAVRNLRNREKGQQDQAHNSYDHKNTGPIATSAESACLESGQHGSWLSGYMGLDVRQRWK
jgi:hypothetical protein